MGFADTGASRLRNNRNLLGKRARMNEALMMRKSDKEKTTNKKTKISGEDYQKFKSELKEKKNVENRKLISSLVFLVLLAILAAVLFLIL